MADAAEEAEDRGGSPDTTVARNPVDRYFRISERGSTVGTEIRGGVVTFFTMAYIVILNPLILGSTPDVNGDTLSLVEIAAVTAFAAAVMSIAFGAITRFPFAFATGLGINSMVAVTIAQRVSWAEAMGLVVVEGVIIVVLAITGFRSAVFNAVPGGLRAAITVGIGMFIAMVGFVDAGFVTRVPDAADTTVPVGLGIDHSIASWPTALFLLGLLLCGVLVARGVKAGLFIGIVTTTVLAIIVEAIVDAGPSVVDGEPNPTGWSLAVPEIPSGLGGVPNLALIGQVDLFGAFTSIGPLAASMFVFTLLLANFFDAMGTMTGLAREADLTDEQGNMPDMRKAFVVEGVGAVVGGATSSSSSTVFLESASGIAEGARTGLAPIVTGVLFVIAMFFTPVYEIVPVEAAAPALIVVGAMMVAQIRFIDLTDFSVALPAFLTMVVMPFTYSIANGLGIGFIAWVVLQTAVGRGRRVHPLLWVVAVAFVIFFVAGPIQDALA